MADLKEWISVELLEAPQKLQPWQELVKMTTEVDKFKLGCDAMEQQLLKDQSKIELLEQHLCQPLSFKIKEQNVHKIF